ncbi:hypothetical protein DSO57_1022418 [Entomophthora muscae]|uniref:Uncharacterized protein n=1 Tax=Entomophthora muscae TaxID=34485 RepID=A0ACC2S504_9FUNG|nr:hypothetical protein DSO57_1022418 [Entomophthora muscae]
MTIPCLTHYKDQYILLIIQLITTQESNCELSFTKPIETPKKFKFTAVALKNSWPFRVVEENDNLDAPKSQNTEPESNPGQNPSRTARLIGWEHDNPLLIKEVATSLPGPKLLAVPQDFASKLPVQDAENSPKVPTPDTSGLPSEIDKSPPGNYSKLSQSSEEGTEPKEAPNTQINKQKDLKSSHPKAASGKMQVPSDTLPSETPDANPPESRKPDQEVKPGSVG